MAFLRSIRRLFSSSSHVQTYIRVCIWLCERSGCAAAESRVAAGSCAAPRRTQPRERRPYLFGVLTHAWVGAARHICRDAGGACRELSRAGCAMQCASRGCLCVVSFWIAECDRHAHSLPIMSPSLPYILGQLPRPPLRRRAFAHGAPRFAWSVCGCSPRWRRWALHRRSWRLRCANSCARSSRT